MKKKGSIIEFTEVRDRELHWNFMEILRTERGVPLRDMFGMAAWRKASRFWVSELRAAVVIGAMLRGEDLGDMLPKRREMFEEIYRRVVALRKKRPELSIAHAVSDVVCSSAPEFYLSDESARTIIYKFRQRKNNRHGKSIGVGKNNGVGND